MSTNGFMRGILATGIGIALATAPASAAEPDPYERPDDTWISIGGEVGSVSRDAFTLDYGDGVVVVEMDDGDRDADGYSLLRGDKVIVSGRIDDDFFEMTKIEAASVYVESIDTHFLASSADEEDWYTAVTAPVVVSKTVIEGRVTGVGASDFAVDSGLRRVTVDVSKMAYDPLDDEGYQQIDVGDLVSVTGTMDDDLFEGRHLEASRVVTLVDS